MVECIIDRSFGRRAFGADPASYHSVRPPNPDWVFATLVQRCGLGDGKSVFEIGPGTGTATRRLLYLGARPLIAVEPDPSLAAYLRKNNQVPALEVMVSAFEDAALEESAFDLGVCATAFHWLDEGETDMGHLARSLHFESIAPGIAKRVECLASPVARRLRFLAPRAVRTVPVRSDRDQGRSVRAGGARDRLAAREGGSSSVASAPSSRRVLQPPGRGRVRR